jgi:hypothetical protein
MRCIFPDIWTSSLVYSFHCTSLYLCAVCPLVKRYWKVSVPQGHWQTFDEFTLGDPDPQLMVIRALMTVCRPGSE